MLIESNTTYSNIHTSPTITPAITRNHLTFPERIMLVEEMRKIITVIGNGVCAYNEGWSDEIVAKELIGGRATILNVIAIRKECFGRLIEYSKVRKLNTAARISKLELRIERLENDLKTMFLRK
jgi:hypothetical protein